MKESHLCSLALCLCLSLSACASSAPGAPVPTTDWTNKMQTETTAPAPEDPEDAWVVLPEFNTAGTIEETLLVDEQGVKITATGLHYSDYQVEIQLLLENNSTRKLEICCGTLGYSRNSVNGCMISDGYINCDLEPGKKANDSISLDMEMLNILGIQEIADLELGFYFNDEDYHSTYLPPVQLKTSLYETHDYAPDYFQDSIQSTALQKTLKFQLKTFSRDTLYDQDGVTLLSSGIILNQSGDHAAFLEFENTTDHPVELALSGASANDLIFYGISCTSQDVNPGKRIVLLQDLSYAFESSYAPLYGITDVGSVGFTIHQCNDENDDISAPARISCEIPGADKPVNLSAPEVYSKNGLRILSMGVAEDSSEYDDSLHLLLLAENHSGLPLNLQNVYDSLSVNGFMADYSFYGIEIPDGFSAILDIEIREDWQEENNIQSPDQITEAEISLDIRSGRTDLDQADLKITY